MVLTREMIIQKLNEQIFALMVTQSKTGMSSRTMMFAYKPENSIFMLTHKGTLKLDDIKNSPVGLVHISALENDLIQSYDISMSGTFEIINDGSPLYQDGREYLGKKNNQIRDILKSESGKQYEMLLFHITSLSGWSYYQIVNGQPKTYVI